MCTDVHGEVHVGLPERADEGEEGEGLPVPAICKRDGCGGSHYHPVTGAEPDYHYQQLRNGVLSFAPRWRNVWKRGKDRRNWWYSPTEVAEALNVGRRTVLRMIADDRKLPAVKLSATVIRIRGSDLEAWIKTQGKLAP